MPGNERMSVVITGASAGLGRAIAIEFATHGWNVGLIARGHEGLRGAAADVEDHGGTALILPADVADPSAVESAADRAAAEWGGIDVWVNGAMVTVLSPVREMRAEEYRRVTEVTYLGQVHGTLAALKHMRRQNEGTIVQVGSALAYRSIPWQSAYCASKSAVRGFTDSLRSELLHEKSGIRISMVQCPGMNTPQFDWSRNRLTKKPQPVPPIFQPEVAARAVYRAALEAPRELWVGGSTAQAIVGQMVAPGLLDGMMAKRATKGQLSKQPADPNQDDNLFEPVEGDFGPHGPFAKRSSDQGLVLNPTTAREALAWTALGVGAAALGYLASRSRRREVAANGRTWDPPRLSRRRPVGGDAETAAPIAYPPIEKHAVVGDRRTAAMVAADGTLNWMCLPNYDGGNVFGSLIDAEQGGFWYFGPASPALGHQKYRQSSTVLITSWSGTDWELELTDTMLWPQTERDPGDEDRRVVLRRMRCTRGTASAVMRLRPRNDFKADAMITPVEGGLHLTVGDHSLGFWISHSVVVAGAEAGSAVELRKGQEIWAVLGLNEAPDRWSVKRARKAMGDADAYWCDWLDRLTYTGPRRVHVLRSSLTFHLLTFAPSGAVVAAPTTSLPERIGGNKNYDYRFTWVRDISLGLATTAVLGDTDTAEQYMDWLVQLDSATDMPLQVLYRIDGSTDTKQRERDDIAGYRGSRPVHEGNQAYKQHQIDGLGFFSHCAIIYLREGGRWKSEYWDLVRKLADYTVETWRRPGSGIWELGQQHHYVTSKVMAWVTLDRAIKVAEELGENNGVDVWRSTMDAIHDEVMDRGWSEKLQAFRQHYDADTLDASVLLLPIMDFLPPDHPRVLATIDRIAERLTIDGFVYRFDPEATFGKDKPPLGEGEGAFVACTFWLAAAYAMAGKPDTAEVILERVEAIAGDTGLFAEQVDPRGREFLGNTPLLLSHAAYMMAVRRLAQARPLDRARMMVGMGAKKAEQLFGGAP
jgi:GH15 family glucan-1,4-alpha-glucosidase/NAD(P)-dependent dehydrogenase (short-subunit alcohol dehydrogenase family)